MNKEISRIVENPNSSEKQLENSRNSSYSRTNEITFNEGLIDRKIWSVNNNETQDSNQLKEKFESLKRKKKGTSPPKNKIKKPITQFIPNPLNYDNADADEFCREDLDENVANLPVNRISSMQIKNNNISSVNQNSAKFVQNDFCYTEPDKMQRSLFSQGNPAFLQTTPQKIRGSFVWNYENALPNFPTIMHRNSVVSNRSTHYSSNNPIKHGVINFEEDGSVDFVEAGVSPYGTNDE